MKRHLLAAEFYAQPWALMPERLNSAAAFIEKWASGQKSMDDDDYVEQKSAFESRRAAAQDLAGGGQIAVLPLYGTIIQRAGMVSEYCGGTSTQQFTSAFRGAMNDPSVSSILIDIDSPGGSVYGTSELAEEIYQARGKKNIVAIANSLAASAAYWIGCSASEFYVTPGGEVGSIGVWQAHQDASKYYEAMGVKTTLISAGKYKTEGNSFGPLAEETQQFLQQRTDDYYAAFTKAVSRGRGVPVASVRNGMGEGRVLGADQAMAEKMVDGIATFDDVVRKMQRNNKSSARSRVAVLNRSISLL